MNAEQSLKINIGFVHDVKCLCFINQCIQSFDVVKAAMRQQYKGWDSCFNIIKRMQFYRSFVFAERCSPKHTKAKINCGGVKGINVSFNNGLEILVCCYGIFSQVDQLIGKVLINAVIPLFISICQVIA